MRSKSTNQDISFVGVRHIKWNGFPVLLKSQQGLDKRKMLIIQHMLFSVNMYQSSPIKLKPSVELSNGKGEHLS